VTVVGRHQDDRPRLDQRERPAERQFFHARLRSERIDHHTTRSPAARSPSTTRPPIESAADGGRRGEGPAAQAALDAIVAAIAEADDRVAAADERNFAPVRVVSPIRGAA